MTDILLRPASLNDLGRMVEIEIAAATLFPTSVLPMDVGRSGSPQEIRTAIEAALAWVAEATHNSVVGFLVADAVATSMHLVEMDVLPSHGRQGIGGALLEHSAAQAETLGFREITLTTFLNIPWNAPFYGRHGFKVAGSFTRYPHLEQALQREASRGLKGRIAMYRDAA